MTCAGVENISVQSFSSFGPLRKICIKNILINRQTHFEFYIYIDRLYIYIKILYGYTSAVQVISGKVCGSTILVRSVVIPLHS